MNIYKYILYIWYISHKIDKYFQLGTYLIEFQFI